MRLALVLLLAMATAIPAGMAKIDLAGYQKLLASQKGKVLLVNFWATYCVPCRKEMPALVALAERHRAKGLVFATVSADEAEDEARALNFLIASKAPAPHYLRQTSDEDAFIQAVEPKWSGALPATILYDRAGKKLRSWIGEADLKAVEAAVLAALK